MSKPSAVKALIACAALSAIAFSSALSAGGGDARKKKPDDAKILVLGFNSALLTDLEDRLFRETLMRAFREKGYPIVTVMDLEALFQREGVKQVRCLGNTDLKKLMSKCGADYGITGTLAPRGRGVKKVKSGETYVLYMTMYVKYKDAFVSFTVESPGAAKPGDFYSSMTSKAAAEVDAYISR